MRYIKTFNENIDNFKEELLDFCESNLAYLLDDGELYTEDSISDLIRVDLTFDQEKEWVDIKDYIITFLIKLTKNYEVVEKNTKGVDLYIFSFSSIRVPTTEYNIKDLIEDKVQLSRIKELRFFVSRTAQKLQYYRDRN